MSFSGKVVLVTGGSSGIGAAVAVGFATKGASVAIVGRNELKLKQVAAEVEKKGQKILVIRADVSNDDDVKTIVKQTVDKFGKLDILINNVGMIRTGSILNRNFIQSYDETIRINLRSIVYLTSFAASHIAAAKGNIVNISSVSGSRVPDDPKLVSYAVSKAGLDHFTRCIALELAPLGVRVNAIQPGPVKTDVLLNAGFKDNEEEIWNGYKSKTALGKVAEPEEISDLVLFLSSDKAKSITGSVFVSDNGYLLKC